MLLAPVIDLHSHILPGIDDGPVDLEGSLALARAAVGVGIATLAATPHVNSRFQVREADLEALPARVQALNAELVQRGIALTVVKGAEVSLSRVSALAREEMVALCLGEGDCLLVESPYSAVVPMIDDLLFKAQAQGIRPVLAHPERCPAFQSNPQLVANLVERGTLCLLNAGSLGGSFGRGPQNLALSLLAEGLVHAVSSDAHDHERRPPGLLEGLATAERELPGLSEEVDRLTRHAPAAMLAGEPVPAPPKIALRRFGLRWLLRRSS